MNIYDFDNLEQIDFYYDKTRDNHLTGDCTASNCFWCKIESIKE
jgi:hypothetical protein